MKPRLNKSATANTKCQRQAISLSQVAQKRSLSFGATADLRLPELRFSAALSTPWWRAPSSCVPHAGLVAPAPALACSSISPSLDGWLRDPMADGVWLDPAVRHWRTATFVRLYVLGCDGLVELRNLLGTSVFKIGLTELSVESRVRKLNRERYASHYVSPAGWTSVDGFDDWHPKTPVLPHWPSPASPVVVMTNCIGIRLPECMSFRDFDRALNEHLGSVSIDSWCRRQEGTRELERRHLDPGIGRRGTPAKAGGIGRIDEAYELFFFRPRREFSALVAIAEHIVLQALRQSISA